MISKLKMALIIAVIAYVNLADASVDMTVEAHQRYPWNGLVDIVVTLKGVSVDEVADVKCFFAATNGTTGAAVPVTSIVRNGSDTGSGTTWTRRVVWDATTDVGTVKIDDVALTVEAKIPDSVQLWENGPYWAKCNVGATKPEEYGYYFWWGDTVGYKRNAANNGWISVKDGSSFSFGSSNCPTWCMDNSKLQSAGYVDSTGNLVAAHDAATAHLGAPWRMPTYAEFDALFSNCDIMWTTRNGVYGRLVTGRGAYASKSIFLPAAGHVEGSVLYKLGSYGQCWSSTSGTTEPNHSSWILYFDSSYCCMGGEWRCRGLSVRPLREFANGAKSDSQTCVGATTHLKLDCLTGVRICSGDGEVLRYDASWYEEGREIRITVDDAVIVTGVAGGYTWHPGLDTSAPHRLKLEVLSSEGLIVGTETAQFALGYVRNVTARQLWPHKKVEVCYTLADDIGEVAGENSNLVLSCGTGDFGTSVPSVWNASYYPWTQLGTMWESGGKGVASLSTSYITCSVTGPATVSFKWMVSSESGFDKLHFYVDGNEVFDPISGTVYWSAKTYSLGSGTHTLKWSYTKDSSVNSGSDCGWVDAITVSSGVTGGTAKTVYGDTRCTPGPHRVVWDMEADGVKVKADEMKFTVGF